MERDTPVKVGAHREDRVRALGFDPDHLTPEEQAELLEMHLVVPDRSWEERGEEVRFS